MATGVPAASVEREVRASVIGMTTGAGLMALLAVGLAFVFGRRVARPVIALASSVRGFGAGEPPAPLPVSGVDEVREVARAKRRRDRVLQSYDRDPVQRPHRSAQKERGSPSTCSAT